MTAPLIVLPDPLQVASTARRLRDGGHVVQEGFRLPEAPFDLSDQRLLCAGIVDTSRGAIAALVAAVRGTGLLLAVGLGPQPTEQFLADLRRVGTVRVEAPEPMIDTPALGPGQRELLELLADGATIPEAARQLYVSVRTAERRLGEARRVLGVRTTAEAITALRLET